MALGAADYAAIRLARGQRHSRLIGWGVDRMGAGAGPHSILSSVRVVAGDEGPVGRGPASLPPEGEV